MPRRSSGGRSRSSRAAPARNPPQPVHHAPPPAPAPSGGGGGGSFLGAVAEGMALGTGISMAHRAVDAVMGPRTIQHETVVSQAPAAAAPAPTANSFGGDVCNVHSKAFQDVSGRPGRERKRQSYQVEPTESLSLSFSSQKVLHLERILNSFHCGDDCLNSYGSDISKCQFYMDMLADCKRNSGAALSA